jgi:hypothetical protein
LWNVEDHTLSRQPAHRRRYGCQLYAPAALYSPETLFFMFLFPSGVPTYILYAVFFTPLPLHTSSIQIFLSVTCSQTGKDKVHKCLTNEALRHEDVWGSGYISPCIVGLGTNWM